MTNIFTSREGRQTFYVGGGGSYDDVDEELDVSEASKLSAGARGPEILVDKKDTALNP